jgi:hypothetical protein
MLQKAFKTSLQHIFIKIYIYFAERFLVSQGEIKTMCSHNGQLHHSNFHSIVFVEQSETTKMSA